ncbi:MAG TPA: ABC transporter ATP-binding protein [Gaiellaceae bacterium]|nr:ABC transporter ATP-binding protein [Gaiellaceae bacterium]
MTDVVIRADELGKRYRIRHAGPSTTLTESTRAAFARLRRRPPKSDFWALRNVSFEVRSGEVLGVIGSNGAGKSTLLKLLARITEPTEGVAEVRGRVGSLLEVGTGFHPELTGRDNVFLNGAILGMKRAEISRKFEEIVDFSGVEAFIDVPVKRYSSGMQVRLAFAVAAFLEPEILLVDEVLSVGDHAFQEKSLDRIHEVTRSGRTVLFVSHNMASLLRLCSRGMLLEQGTTSFEGPIEATVERYLSRRLSVHAGGELLEDIAREGTGTLRFRRVSVSSANGLEPRAGEPVIFTLELKADHPVSARELNLSIGIETRSGDRLVTLWNRFDPTQTIRAGLIQDGTVVTCTVPELPLRPERYLLTLYLDDAGDLVDFVPHQIEFEVMPTDFFGTSLLPSATQGPVLVRQQWRLGSSLEVAQLPEVGHGTQRAIP